MSVRNDKKKLINLTGPNTSVLPVRQRRHICGECGKKRLFKKLYLLKSARHWICFDCIYDLYWSKKNNTI